MHVAVRRTGGFAGIPFTKRLDAANLSRDETVLLQGMVEKASFFQLPSVIPFDPQPDRFQYEITIELEGKKHSVTVAEPAIPPELKRLVDWLMARGEGLSQAAE